MNNADKYELIVKIKELLLKSTQFDLENMQNAYEISIEASKVLQLIYSNKELTDNFEHKLNEYYEQKKNKKYFEEVKSLFLNLIKRISPDVYVFDDEFLFSYYRYFKGLGFSYFKETFTEIKTKETEKFKKIFMDYSSFSSWQFGILPYFLSRFNLISKEYISFDSKYSDVFYSLLAHTYDFYFLSKYEQYFFEYDVFPTSIYLLLAYKQVLNDCLIVAYKINLSEGQKQEYDLKTKKEKLWNIAKVILTEKQFPIYETILNDLAIDLKGISNIVKSDKNTINSHIQGSETQKGITERITGKKGGIKVLKSHIKQELYSN